MDRSLKIFCDLVETHSFTETGRRNYLTQSAVSQHLKALETKFGHRLIERHHRQLSLTRSGQLVYEAAQDILWRYQRLARLLERPSTVISGTLRIAASLTVGLYELPSHLSAFLRQHPGVDLKLDYLQPSEVYDAVLKDVADLGLVAYPEPHPHLIIHLFKKDRLAVILPAKHPWARLKRISLKRLHGQPFVAMAAGLPMRRAIDRLFKEAHIHAPVVHEFDNVELIKRAVEVASGFSIVPRKAITAELAAGTLAQLDIAEGPVEHPIGILTRKGAARSPSAQQLITALLSPQARR